MAKVYTNMIANNIAEMFEDVLDNVSLNEMKETSKIYGRREDDKGVFIPDDDREGNDGESPLYGVTYYDLVDRIEEELLDLVKHVKDGDKIVPYVLSDDGEE